MRLVEGSVLPVATATAAATLAPDGSATYEFDLALGTRRGDAAGRAGRGAHRVDRRRPGAWGVGGGAGPARPPGPGHHQLRPQRSPAAHGESRRRPRPGRGPGRRQRPGQGQRRGRRLAVSGRVGRGTGQRAGWAWVLRSWSSPAAGAGMLGLCRAGRVEVPAPRVDVADTVGAGDSAMAALLDGLWGARPPRRAGPGPPWLGERPGPRDRRTPRRPPGGDHRLPAGCGSPHPGRTD